MRNVLTQVSVAVLVAACSAVYPAQELPTVVLPTTGHSSDVVAANGDAYFVVTLGRLPLIFTTDFIPG